MKPFATLGSEIGKVRERVRHGADTLRSSRVAHDVKDQRDRLLAKLGEQTFRLIAERKLAVPRMLLDSVERLATLLGVQLSLDLDVDSTIDEPERDLLGEQAAGMPLGSDPERADDAPGAPYPPLDEIPHLGSPEGGTTQARQPSAQLSPPVSAADEEGSAELLTSPSSSSPKTLPRRRTAVTRETSRSKTSVPRAAKGEPKASTDKTRRTAPRAGGSRPPTRSRSK